jgi:hypothetical protein
MVDIYIKIGEEYRRIEQFDDEKVSVTSSVQNFNDIGKLFTDYSQSFTIPASKINNSIFSHWYNSNVDDGFDHRRRYDAYIEIDTLFFKAGKLQIEKANKNDGYIENYQVTFYGNLTQLKDKFKEDKLNVVFGTALGLALNHNYTPSEVINRISLSTNYDVRYPLVGNNRRLTYNDGGSTDVTTNAGAIPWNDLFPAVRVNKIFDMIEQYYGLEFTGTFFNYVQVNELWLLLKNAELPRGYSQGQRVNFLNKTGGTPFPELNLTTDVITTSWTTGFASIIQQRLKIFLIISPTSPTVIYKVDFYVDGVIYNTFDNLTGNIDIVLYDQSRADDPSNHQMYIVVSSIGSITFTSILTYHRYSIFGASLVTRDSYGENTTGQTIPYLQNLFNYVPDIKVADFFMGIVKMFNMVVTPTSETAFHFEPLDLFYESGEVKKASKYIDAMEIDIDKPKLFKAINFVYEKSENILNNNFRGLFNREYGDLVFDNPESSESSNYEIKLPFENPMWERTTGFKFMTNTFLNNTLSPYTPKPVLMYRNGLELLGASHGDHIKFRDGSTHYDISQYQRFSNEINTAGTDLSYLMSLNWGNEISPWYLVNAPQGLYQRLYDNYVSNLYNLKTRVLKVKGKVTSFFLNSLKLKDRLTIRNNRYIINTMTTDLTTNEVNFELITDYRSVAGFNNIGYRFANINNLIIDNTAQKIEVVFYRGGYESILVPTNTGFVTSTGTGIVYGDVIVELTISANGTASERTHIVNSKFTDSQGNVTDFNIPILQNA